MKRFPGMLLWMAALLILTTSCAVNRISKQDAFPKMYVERPISILVLPPMNESTAADAKEYYSTTVVEPLTYAGYYVFPLEVVSDVLKNEGIFDTETLLGIPPQKFRETFGADAVLYVRILKWDTAYYVIGGNVTVSVDFHLKSTHTGDDLWKYEGTMVLDTSGDSGGAPGLAGLIAHVITTAIKTAMADYLPVARRANYLAVSALPCGKYHPRCGTDRADQVINQVANKQEAQ